MTLGPRSRLPALLLSLYLLVALADFVLHLARAPNPWDGAALAVATTGSLVWPLDLAAALLFPAR